MTLFIKNEAVLRIILRRLLRSKRGPRVDFWVRYRIVLFVPRLLRCALTRTSLKTSPQLSTSPAAEDKPNHAHYSGA